MRPFIPGGRFRECLPLFNEDFNVDYSRDSDCLNIQTSILANDDQLNIFFTRITNASHPTIICIPIQTIVNVLAIAASRGGNQPKTAAALDDTATALVVYWTAVFMTGEFISR